jgi:hypothetical protein
MEPMRNITSSKFPRLSYLHELDEYDILNHLPSPDRRYRLDQLLKQRVDHDAEFVPAGKFETVQWCKSEDKRRASALRAVSYDAPWVQMAVDRDQAPEDLADDLDKHKGYTRPPFSRASAIWTRELRLRFLGNILQFLSERTDPRASGWITISRTHWHLGLSDADWDSVEFDVPRQFRALMRCAGVLDATGFLITCLHAGFDNHYRKMRLEFRGICGGEKLQRFREIDGFIANEANRGLLEDYIGGPGLGQFVTTSYGVKSVLPGLAAMMPNGVACRIATRGTTLTSKRPPEPSYSHYITWLGVMRLIPIVIMSGVGVPYVPYPSSYFEQTPAKPLGLCLCDDE